MISIIICSRNTFISFELSNNIQNTIGVEYELIVIDNSKNRYSIFSAYNEGVSRAKYSYLCFMHEDIFFHTKNWGVKVVNHFNNEAVGMIGVLGGHYLPNKPAHFWDSPYVSGNFILTIDGVQQVFNHNNYFFAKDTYIDVVACDGLWFCLPKTIFDYLKFDDITFTGFHLYDMDISLQVLKIGRLVRVVKDILIEHVNKSDISNLFYDNQYLFYNKWKFMLPISRGIIIDETCKTLIDDYCDVRNRYNLILKSKAYLIGKFILKPFSFVRYNILKK